MNTFVKKNFRRLKELIQYICIYLNPKQFRRRHNLFYVTDGNCLKRIQLENTYQALKKEFQSIIDEGITDKEASVKSDYVWICWFQGFDAAPDLVKACINSVKQNMPDRKIVFLDNSNLNDYVHLPDYIIEKHDKGMISAAHYSDLIRTQLLCEYGGIWADATVLCTSNVLPRSFVDAPLFVFKEMELSPSGNQPTVCSSWFISAETNNEILLLTRKLLFEYWKTHDSLLNYFVFHVFFALAAKRYEDQFKAIPMYNNHSPHTLMFELGDEYTEERWNEIVSVSPIHKLTHHIKHNSEKYTYYKHVLDSFK